MKKAVLILVVAGLFLSAGEAQAKKALNTIKYSKTISAVVVEGLINVKEKLVRNQLKLQKRESISG